MNIGIGPLVRVCAAVALLVPAGSAWAQWQLDGANSSLNFISIKNDAVAETHSFGTLSGSVTAAGAAQLSIDLGSVDTLIEVRDERMREMLFETVKFPTASASAAIAPAILAAVAAGDTVATDLTFKLSLHGIEKSITVPVVLIGEAADQIRVLTASPVIVNAADFGLAEGVAALQAVAGLNAISTAVPVTVNLVFAPVQ